MKISQYLLGVGLNVVQTAVVRSISFLHTWVV